MSTGSDQSQSAPDPEGGHTDGPVDLGRLGWLAIVGTLLVGMIILAVKRDWGYAGVSLAVALSAAINLF